MHTCKSRALELLNRSLRNVNDAITQVHCEVWITLGNQEIHLDQFRWVSVKATNLKSYDFPGHVLNSNSGNRSVTSSDVNAVFSGLAVHLQSRSLPVTIVCQCAAIAESSATGRSEDNSKVLNSFWLSSVTAFVAK